MSLSLPERPSIGYLKKQAKYLLKRQRAASTEVCPILRHLRRFEGASDEEVLSATVSLAEVQFALAMEYGFTDWNALKQHVEEREKATGVTVAAPTETANLAWAELRRAIVAEAVGLGASDTHLESKGDHLIVRQRVDGALRSSGVVVGDEQYRPVLNGFKMMAALDTTVQDEAQIGYCTAEVEGKSLRMRVSVIPYASGESISVRYLAEEPRFFDLDAQGWPAEDMVRIRRWIHRPSGLIIFTGPTGSGRTSTIYGALRELAAGAARKIVTAEDPVEFMLEGVLQHQVGPSEGMSYAEAILAHMRQEPDVMMVGELRDPETVEAAFTAAMTGHLVLTTMHAGDGPSCLRRLLDQKADPYRINSALIGVLSQRLVRRVCEQCRKPYDPPAWMRESLPDLPAGQVFEGAGCAACRNSGFNGRTIIGEMLEMDDALRLLVARNASVDELRRQALASGVRPLRAAGLARVVEGLTTADEVLRVCTA